MKLSIIVSFIISVLAIVFCLNLETRIRNGKIPLNQIRVIRRGSVYIINDIEGLGRNKHFLSFKEE